MQGVHGGSGYLLKKPSEGSREMAIASDLCNLIALDRSDGDQVKLVRTASES